MAGCRTLPKNEIVLPPKPQRVEQEEVHDLKGMASLVNYYKSLVSEWELWGEKVTKTIDKEQK